MAAAQPGEDAGGALHGGAADERARAYGAVCGTKFRTTIPEEAAARPPDLVKRVLHGGWTEPAVRVGPDVRRHAAGLRIRGLRHEARIELSVGSKGDAYDNALAESVIGLFRTEVIRRQGPWRTLEV